MFFNTIHSIKPDLIILCGLHLLEHQPIELWSEKLRLVVFFPVPLQKTTFRRCAEAYCSCRQMHPFICKWALWEKLTTPVTYSTRFFSQYLLDQVSLLQIVPLVDSIGLNEQELAFLSQMGRGPHADQVHSAAYIVNKLQHYSTRCAPVQFTYIRRSISSTGCSPTTAKTKTIQPR